MCCPELKIYPSETDPGTETVKLELDAHTALTLEQAAIREGLSQGQLIAHMVADYTSRIYFWAAA
ncbi:hypothetical protein DIC66_07145 [Rhodoferax lacus]|uniref:CopG family transcriptional regulator n=2 Tax=Rhodoferax lacus TaxID=2184758 RepID=A0A3E1REH5_9BURK|nr:hypothetical protein DIC66_07145 [Rhodoferax lacus]